MSRQNANQRDFYRSTARWSSVNFAHLNRKLDLLARHLATLTPELARGSEQTISLSEGGR